MNVEVDEKGRKWIEHAPGARLDYSFDWNTTEEGEKWLADDENVDTVTFEILGAGASDFVLDESQIETGVTSIMAEGGIDLEDYQLKCSIVTNQPHGRKDNRILILKCRARS
jgi:hypothetical protein